jgi:hypothetical protein
MRLCTGNPAYRFLHILLAPPRPTCTLARRSVVGGFSDLLGEDVCVTGVAGDFTDHAQVDEAHAYCADEAVRGGDLGEGFVLGYVEAAVTADRKAGAVFETPASPGCVETSCVPRQHKNGEFRIVDASSLNGSYVNRHRVDCAVLADGDEIQIRNLRLVFLALRTTQ